MQTSLETRDENEGVVRLGVKGVEHFCLPPARDSPSTGGWGGAPRWAPKEAPRLRGTQTSYKRTSQQLLLLKLERWPRGLCASQDQNTPIKRDQEPGQVHCRWERELNFFFLNKNVKKIQGENASMCSTFLLLVAKPVQLPQSSTPLHPQINFKMQPASV